MARPWSARCYGVARPREGSRQNSIGPRVNLVYQPYARGGADGQAVVCPLLRGSSATRGVAPKQHRGPRRAFSPAFFGLVLLISWRVGAEESGAAWFWFIGFAGAMLLDRIWPPGFRFTDFRAP